MVPVIPTRRKNSSKLRFSNTHRSEASDGEFLWLMSLSDLMMLLFVFFVVLFSFSAKKLNAVEFENIQKAFANPNSLEGTPLDLVQANLLKWVNDKKLLESVSVVRNQEALFLEIKEKLLFEVGSSDLKGQALELIPLLREALGKIPSPYRIGIEGHTDDTPMGPEGLSSTEESSSRNSHSNNWSLSTNRALAVKNALALPEELDHRAVIMGYGPNRPLLPNRDAEGKPLKENQAQNRRVTIRIF